MMLSEVPIEQVAVGDRLISAQGKPGMIVGIYPVGTSSPFDVKVSTSEGTTQILICWLGDRKWSLYENYGMDQVEYDQKRTDEYRAKLAG